MTGADLEKDGGGRTFRQEEGSGDLPFRKGEKGRTEELPNEIYCGLVDVEGLVDRSGLARGLSVESLGRWTSVEVNVQVLCGTNWTGVVSGRRAMCGHGTPRRVDVVTTKVGRGSIPVFRPQAELRKGEFRVWVR